MNEDAQELEAYKQWLVLKNNLNLEVKKIEETIRPQLDQIDELKKKIRELNYCTKCDLIIEGYGGSSPDLEDYCSCSLTGYPKE